MLQVQGSNYLHGNASGLLFTMVSYIYYKYARHAFSSFQIKLLGKNPLQ